MNRSHRKRPRKEQKTCPLCGVTFFSNKRRYCSVYHTNVYNQMKRGSNPLAEVLSLLMERGENGARLLGYWESALSEFNWLENAEKAGFKRLSQHGLDTIKRIHKEQMK